MGKTIEKKILPEYFDRIAAGEKTYELRLADWECESGDKLVLIEIDDETKLPTGRKLCRKIGFVGKTKDLDFWSKEDIDKYGCQIISLLPYEEKTKTQFDELMKRATDIRVKYDKLNGERRRVTWNEQQLMAGFVGDVGDLSKIVMAKHGLREMDNIDAKLAHELSDCLWSVLVLAGKYNIDLEADFLKTMDELDERIDADLSKP